MHRISALTLAAATLPMAAWGAVIPIPSDAADAVINDDRRGSAQGSIGTLTVLSDTLNARIGRQGTAQARLGVFVFELPTLPAGEIVVDADLSFFVNEGEASNFGPGIDIWALPFRASPSVLVTDYLVSDTDSTPGVQKIADDIFGQNVPIPGNVAYETDDTADGLLASFVQTQYDNGGEGNYLFVRVNTEFFYANDRIAIALSENGDDPAPVLTIETAIPEPASVALLGLGLVLVTTRSRGRHQP